MNICPENQNNLQTTKFQVVFPRISNAVYFCQEATLPGVSAQPVEQTNPFVDIPRPGDKISYEPFNMNFIVDEGLYSWEIIYDWIRCYTFPTDFAEYRELKLISSEFNKSLQPQFADAQLYVLSALNNPKLKVNYYNLFPVSLSGITFNTTSSAEAIVTASAQFRYTYYTIERI